MKRKRSASKSVLALCLAVFLALQTVTFSSSVYAGNASDAAEPSVLEAVYAASVSMPVPAYSITMKSNSNASENGWINQTGNVEGAIEWQVNIAAMDAVDTSIPLPLEGL